MADTVISDPQQRHELSDRATKKVFKRLIPFLLLMYVIAFLDRSNVSFAQQSLRSTSASARPHTPSAPGSSLSAMPSSKSRATCCCTGLGRGGGCPGSW